MKCQRLFYSKNKKIFLNVVCWNLLSSMLIVKRWMVAPTRHLTLPLGAQRRDNVDSTSWWTLFQRCVPIGLLLKYFPRFTMEVSRKHYNSLDWFSRRQTIDIWYFCQKTDISCKVFLYETICMKCQSLFSEEKKIEKKSICRPLKISTIMLSFYPQNGDLFECHYENMPI